LCRIGATQYDESIGSLLYPGNTHSYQAFQQAVWQMEDTLHLTPAQREQVILRIDAGFGTDDNLAWSLQQ
jgi:hypothetical protein